MKQISHCENKTFVITYNIDLFLPHFLRGNSIKTGCLPWQKASLDDPRYNKFIQWHNSSFPIKRTPKLFKLISAKASKMFRKFLEPKIERRIKSLNELHKYLDERWLARSAEKEMLGNIHKPLMNHFRFQTLYLLHPQSSSKMN